VVALPCEASSKLDYFVVVCVHGPFVAQGLRGKRVPLVLAGMYR
jgi:hypothetical protein